MVRYVDIKVGNKIPEMLKYDLALEIDAIKRLN